MQELKRLSTFLDPAFSVEKNKSELEKVYLELWGKLLDLVEKGFTPDFVTNVVIAIINKREMGIEFIEAAPLEIATQMKQTIQRTVRLCLKLYEDSLKEFDSLSQQRAEAIEKKFHEILNKDSNIALQKLKETAISESNETLVENEADNQTTDTRTESTPSPENGTSVDKQKDESKHEDENPKINIDEEKNKKSEINYEQEEKSSEKEEDNEKAKKKMQQNANEDDKKENDEHNEKDEMTEDTESVPEPVDQESEDIQNQDGKENDPNEEPKSVVKNEASDEESSKGKVESDEQTPLDDEESGCSDKANEGGQPQSQKESEEQKDDAGLSEAHSAKGTGSETSSPQEAGSSGTESAAVLELSDEIADTISNPMLFAQNNEFEDVERGFIKQQTEIQSKITQSCRILGALAARLQTASARFAPNFPNVPVKSEKKGPKADSVIDNVPNLALYKWGQFLLQNKDDSEKSVKKAQKEQHKSGKNSQETGETATAEPQSAGVNTPDTPATKESGDDHAKAPKSPTNKDSKSNKEKKAKMKYTSEEKSKSETKKHHKSSRGKKDRQKKDSTFSEGASQVHETPEVGVAKSTESSVAVVNDKSATSSSKKDKAKTHKKHSTHKHKEGHAAAAPSQSDSAKEQQANGSVPGGSDSSVQLAHSANGNHTQLSLFGDFNIGESGKSQGCVDDLSGEIQHFRETFLFPKYGGFLPFITEWITAVRAICGSETVVWESVPDFGIFLEIFMSDFERFKTAKRDFIKWEKENCKAVLENPCDPSSQPYTPGQIRWNIVPTYFSRLPEKYQVKSFCCKFGDNSKPFYGCCDPKMLSAAQDAIVSTTSSALAKFIEMRLESTLLTNFIENARTWADIDSWFSLWAKAGKGIAGGFDIEALFDSINDAVELESIRVNNAIISLLHTMMGAFKGEAKITVCNCLFNKCFYWLFLNWDEDIRSSFCKFLIFRVYRSRLDAPKEDKDPASKEAESSAAFTDPTDQTIYEKVNGVIKQLPEKDLPENVDKKLSHYIDIALSTFNAWVEAYKASEKGSRGGYLVLPTPPPEIPTWS